MQNQGIGSWPQRRARLSAERTAFVHDGRRTTYAEVYRRGVRLASRLRSAGVGPGDRVAYLGPNHPSFAETMFATHLLGGVFVPLNFRLAAPELDYVLEHSGAGVLIHADHPAVGELTAKPGTTPGSWAPTGR